MADSEKLEKGVRKFDGTKYSSWKFRIMTLLSELDLDGVVSDPAVRPFTPERAKAEKRAKGVIVKSLEDSLLGFAKGDVTAKEILDNLNVVYERKSVATQLALRKSLIELRLEGDTPLIKHFAVFDDMISELLAAGAELSESDKITHLFITLPSTYGSVVTALETLSGDDLTLPFVKIRLLDHEIKLKKESADTALKALLSLRALHAGDITSNGTEKLDTPEHSNNQQWQSGKSSKNNNSRRFNKRFNSKGTKKFGRSNVKCHYCRKPGHIKKDCFKLKNKRNNGNNNNGNNNYHGNNNDRRDGSGSSGQAQNALVQIPTTVESSGFSFMAGDYPSEDATSGKVAFILDSGASHHLINRSDLACHFTPLDTPFLIQTAKREICIQATKRGDVSVISSTGIAVTLTNVLYCPEIPHNLLSVSKLQEHGFVVTFGLDGVKITKGDLMIQQGKNNQSIAIVEFLLNGNNCSNLNAHAFNASKVNFETWHHRLGHLDNAKFLELKNNE